MGLAALAQLRPVIAAASPHSQSLVRAGTPAGPVERNIPGHGAGRGGEKAKILPALFQGFLEGGRVEPPVKLLLYPTFAKQSVA